MSKLVQDSRGRHALLALLDVRSQKDIDDETKVSQPALSLIASRKRRPGREAAARLAQVGIEFGWWDLPPTPEQLARAAERKAEEEADAEDSGPDSESKPKGAEEPAA